MTIPFKNHFLKDKRTFKNHMFCKENSNYTNNDKIKIGAILNN